MTIILRVFALMMVFGLNPALAQAQESVDSASPEAMGAEMEGSATAAVETATDADVSAPTAEPLAQGSVARALFAANVENHEPVGPFEATTAANDKIYFFTELQGLQGQTVQHRWEYQGEVMADVNFNVGGPRWRVWSSKNLLPEWTGAWTVSVVNGSGDVIASKTLDYQAAPAVDTMPTQASNGAEPAAESQTMGTAAEVTE